MRCSTLLLLSILPGTLLVAAEEADAATQNQVFPAIVKCKNGAFYQGDLILESNELVMLLVRKEDGKELEEPRQISIPKNTITAFATSRKPRPANAGGDASREDSTAPRKSPDEQEREKLGKMIDLRRDKLTRSQTRLGEMEQEVGSLSSELATRTAKVKEIERELRHLAAEYKRVSRDSYGYDKNGNRSPAIERRLQAITMQQSELRGEVKELKKLIPKLEGQIYSTKAGITKLKRSIESLKRTVANLEADRNGQPRPGSKEAEKN